MTPEQERGPVRGHQGSTSYVATPGSSLGGPTKSGGGLPAGPTSGKPDGAPSVAEDAQHLVGQTVSQVRDQGKSQLASQKDRVADTVGSVAHALRETGKQLQQSNEVPVAVYVDRVADRVEQISNHLRQSDIDQLMGETESFARRQPALFLGGAFVLGLVAARFLKSSRPEQSLATTSGGRIPGKSSGAPASESFSWQDSPAQARRAQLLPVPRPPQEPGRMGSGSSSSTMDPRRA